jgi:hypothetical protein
MIVCVVCGDEFFSKREGWTGTQAPKYCSTKCKSRAAYKPRERKTSTVICAVCETAFQSSRAGVIYNAPKFCSDKCFHIDYKRRHPDKVKASRRKTHLKHREKDLKKNKEWWKKNRTKLKKKRAEYTASLPPEKRKEYSRRYYNKHTTRERERRYKAYYLGHENPKGDLGWLKKARTTLRNAQRELTLGVTPEACVSQRIRSRPDEISPT